MSTTTRPVCEAKRRFTELVNDAEEFYSRYLVTKNGKNAAVIASAEEFDSLLETLDILSNKPEFKAIVEGATQVRNKKTQL